MKVVVALAATASALVAPVAKVAPATSLDAKSAAMPFLECPAALDGLDYPGNVGFDPLGLKPEDPEALKEMQTKELQHGRLAMLAAAGMIVQELQTGATLF